MSYRRPVPISKLGKEQKVSMLGAYYEHYRQLAARDPYLLNRKIPREAFTDLVDQIGTLLVDQTRELASRPGPVRVFLDDNALPEPIAGLLPNDFRVFCLALNALKQWLSAEQLATDRFLLGGTGRQVCRDAAKTCIVTGDQLQPNSELHHPIRDGRPPIPLSKRGHVLVENRSTLHDDDPHRSALLALKRKSTQSWKNLRRGCLDLLGETAIHSTPKVGASSRTFARKASKTTGMTYEEIVLWLDKHGC